MAVTSDASAFCSRIKAHWQVYSSRFISMQSHMHVIYRISMSSFLRLLKCNLIHSVNHFQIEFRKINAIFFFSERHTSCEELSFNIVTTPPDKIGR